MTKTATVDDPNELRLNGMEALNRALGPTGAMRFMAQIQRESTDYVDISRRIYDSQSVDEIYERASKAWNRSV